MMKHKIYCLNNISQVGLETLSQTYELTDQIDSAEGILVRSAVMHDMVLPESVLAIARAGAGVNNIPLDTYAKQGVVVFNTPGANANAVKELTIAGLLLASRDIFGGMTWLKEESKDPDIQKTIEKKKATFGGTEILGKTIGIVGLGGAIGFKIAQSCHYLGMHVIGYEANPNAPKLKELPEGVQIAHSLEEMLPIVDFLSINVPLLDSTKHMINQKSISLMKDGVVILNFARDLLVLDDDLNDALKSRKVRLYVTDFPNSKTVNMEHVLAIPHLGASTEEAEDNCAIMAVEQVEAYIDHGSIINSVNFPNITLEPKQTTYRLTIMYESEVDRQDEITSNISNVIQEKPQHSVFKKGFGYLVFDINQMINENQLHALNALKGVLRTRLI